MTTPNPHVNKAQRFDPPDDVEVPGDGNWQGWLSEKSREFDVGVVDLKQALDDILEKLGKDPGNPAFLAEYQAKLSEYTLYRGLQSKTIEALAGNQRQSANRVGA